MKFIPLVHLRHQCYSNSGVMSHLRSTYSVEVLPHVFSHRLAPVLANVELANKMYVFTVSVLSTCCADGEH